MKRAIFYAVHGMEVIPCHPVAPKDRDGTGRYAANSKRDRRRFNEAFDSKEKALEQATAYSERANEKD